MNIPNCDCPYGYYYEDNTDSLLCDTCSMECDTCSNTSSNCNSCAGKRVNIPNCECWDIILLIQLIAHNVHINVLPVQLYPLIASHVQETEGLCRIAICV